MLAPHPELSPYEQHREYVLAVLRRRCGWLDPTDREALLHDAYTVFLEKQRDQQLNASVMRPPQIRAYLTQTALNKAMDEGKRAGRRRSVSLDDEDLGLDPADPGRELDEHLAARLDDARVREIVAELPERQQLVIKLRFFFDRAPLEIQRYLGVTERVYRRELERATRYLAERYDLVREGTFCESRRSLILAYVTGVAGPNRMAEARRHLDTCPACMQWASELRAAVRRAAALVPPPLVVGPAHHALIAAWSSAVHGAGHRAGSLLGSAREHALRVMLRADPAKTAAFSNVRPGAAAALVAGCFAVGSTATYCVVQGLPAPLRTLVGVGATAPQHHRQPPATTTLTRTAARHRLTTPLPPVVPAHAPRRAVHTPRAVVHHKPTTTASATHATTPAQRVHVATSAEFGVGHGAPAPATGSTQSAGSSAPPPKPSTHLPEFDP